MNSIKTVDATTRAAANPFHNRTAPQTRGFCAGVSVKHIERAGLLAVALGATVVLATGCSSTGTGFGARLIKPVPNNQPAINFEDDSWYQPVRSPGFDPDLRS